MKKKLLIFGISGLTGYKITKIANTKYDVIGIFNEREIILEDGLSRKLDITDNDQLKKIFYEIKPDIVINTTALHNVDYCEEHKSQAYKVNSESIKNMAEYAEKLDSKLIHMSTDYVFDGEKNSLYTELDEPNPISYYGKTKLNGEKFLGLNNTIIRTSVIYGWTPLELAGTISSSGKPINFALWILTKLNKTESMKIVTDQFASATLADSLAESILQMAETDKSGLYHISGLSCESRYEFAVKLAKKFGYDSSLISPTTSESFVQKAKRPVYSCLNCKKAINDFGLKLLTTDESLDMMKSQVEKEAPHLLGNYNN